MDGVSADTCAANRTVLQRGIEHNAAEIRRVDSTAMKRLDAHAGQIDELKDTMNTLAATQQIVAATQERLSAMQEKQDQRISSLESRGGRRWEKIAETALVAVVSAVMGAMMAGLLPR